MKIENLLNQIKMHSVVLLPFLLVFACHNPKNTVTQNEAMRPFVIYKTKANYENLVPVLLNEEKTAIVSYPAPSDLRLNDKLALPTPLKNGYCIDNRGIGPNAAFLSITYQEYASLAQAPPLKTMYDAIVDNDPFIEMYDCRNFSKERDNIKKMNSLVKTGFKNCQKLK